MKKVFIGCGIVVFIALLAGGYLVWGVWPSMSRLVEQWMAAADELDALDREYPFDPHAQEQLDPARFEQMLDVRVELADYFATFTAQMEAMKQEHEGQDAPGVIGQLRQVFDQIAPVLTEVAARLREAKMSPQEFSFHTRVMWGVLARVDSNLAGNELDALRGRYSKFKADYDTLQRDERNHFEKLDLLLASLPPEALKTAEQIMARDPARISRALSMTDIDPLYMQPQRIKDGPNPAALAPRPAEPAPADAAPVEPVPNPEPAPAPR
ncbi:MAG TPA: hypothetical protein VMV01_06730 [Planctomycetota bacterium]|jgi:hypothetical protein|nr:hypothetical protein [Planctomycetota bacterium]